MSTITITFTDNENGTVSTSIFPAVTELLAKWKQPGGARNLTAAEGYAIRCINAARETSDKFTRDGQRQIAQLEEMAHTAQSVIRKKLRGQ